MDSDLSTLRVIPFRPRGPAPAGPRQAGAPAIRPPVSAPELGRIALGDGLAVVLMIGLSLGNTLLLLAAFGIRWP